MDEGSEFEEKIKNDGENDNRYENYDCATYAHIVKPVEMTKLGDEKEDQTDFGKIIDGENTIGDKSGEHSYDQEVVMTEVAPSINDTKQDAAETNGGKDRAAGDYNAKNYIGSKNSEPDSGPGCGKDLSQFEMV